MENSRCCACVVPPFEGKLQLPLCTYHVLLSKIPGCRSRCITGTYCMHPILMDAHLPPLRLKRTDMKMFPFRRMREAFARRQNTGVGCLRRCQPGRFGVESTHCVSVFHLVVQFYILLYTVGLRRKVVFVHRLSRRLISAIGTNVSNNA